MKDPNNFKKNINASDGTRSSDVFTPASSKTKVPDGNQKLQRLLVGFAMSGLLLFSFVRTRMEKHQTDNNQPPVPVKTMVTPTATKVAKPIKPNIPVKPTDQATNLAPLTTVPDAVHRRVQKVIKKKAEKVALSKVNSVKGLTKTQIDEIVQDVLRQTYESDQDIAGRHISPQAYSGESIDRAKKGAEAGAKQGVKHQMTLDLNKFLEHVKKPTPKAKTTKNEP